VSYHRRFSLRHLWSAAEQSAEHDYPHHSRVTRLVHSHHSPSASKLHLNLEFGISHSRAFFNITVWLNAGL
jgi:hypothetical protein